MSGRKLWTLLRSWLNYKYKKKKIVSHIVAKLNQDFGKGFLFNLVKEKTACQFSADKNHFNLSATCWFCKWPQIGEARFVQTSIKS